MSYTKEECDEIIELVREKNKSDYEGQIAFSKKKGVIKVAIKLKSMNFPLAQIAEVTDLSYDEVEKL